MTLISKEKVPALVTFGRGVYSGMNGATGIFIACNPTMAAFLGLLNALDQAQQDMGHIKGAAGVRKTRRDAFWTALESERIYVQTLADASPEQSQVIIEASGFKIAAVGLHTKDLLEATAMGNGVVQLVANMRLLTTAKASKTRKTFVNWQSTSDGSKTFNNLPSTTIGHTTVANLTPFTTWGFRVSITDSKGTGDWSQVVSVVVH